MLAAVRNESNLFMLVPAVAHARPNVPNVAMISCWDASAMLGPFRRALLLGLPPPCAPESPSSARVRSTSLYVSCCVTIGARSGGARSSLSVSDVCGMVGFVGCRDYVVSVFLLFSVSWRCVLLCEKMALGVRAELGVT